MLYEKSPIFYCNMLKLSDITLFWISYTWDKTPPKLPPSLTLRLTTGLMWRKNPLCQLDLSFFLSLSLLGLCFGSSSEAVAKEEKLTLELEWEIVPWAQPLLHQGCDKSLVSETQDAFFAFFHPKVVATAVTTNRNIRRSFSAVGNELHGLLEPIVVWFW